MDGEGREVGDTELRSSPWFERGMDHFDVDDERDMDRAEEEDPTSSRCCTGPDILKGKVM